MFFSSLFYSNEISECKGGLYWKKSAAKVWWRDTIGIADPATFFPVTEKRAPTKAGGLGRSPG